jgi:hypothetical protein
MGAGMIFDLTGAVVLLQLASWRRLGGGDFAESIENLCLRCKKRPWRY